MDGWEWNKLAASVLAAAAFVLAVHFAAEAIFTVPPLQKPVYVPPQDKPASDRATPAGGAEAADPQ